jgi:uncharacterized protein (DUF608 family)
LFEATYPVATIHYISKDLPVEIILKAGAIFIPLDADNSALPATVFSIDIKNTGSKNIDVAVAGWLENGANKITAKDEDGTKQNEAVIQSNYTAISSSFRAKNAQANTQRDAGTTCIACIGANAQINTNARPWPVDEKFFSTKNENPSNAIPSEKLTGSIVATQAVEGR